MDEIRRYNIAIQRAFRSISEVTYRDTETIQFTGKGTVDSPLRATVIGGGGGSASFATLTGAPGDNTALATYVSDAVNTAVANVVASAPALLNTLDELAAALNDDANFATTTANSLALKAPIATPSFTTYIGLNSQSSGPAAPTDGIRFYSRKKARLNAAYVNSQGIHRELQMALWTGKNCMCVARGNGTTTDTLGMNVTSNTAHVAVNVGTGSLFSSIRRIGMPSTASAGTVGGIRNNAVQYFIGDAAGKGGWFFVTRCGINTNVSDGRGIIGFSGSGNAMTNIEPSTFTNWIGFAYDAADTNWKFMHNDAAGNCTIVDLGANFPCKTNSVDWYEFRIYCPPNGSAIEYSAERINSGHYAEGTASTNLPGNTTLLSWQLALTNNATASLVQMDFSHIFIETEN